MRWKAHATHVRNAQLFAVAHAFQRVKAETSFLTVFMRWKAHATYFVAVFALEFASAVSISAHEGARQKCNSV
jgi:hypothetical protein